MTDGPWSAARVLALAPDPAAARAGQGLAGAAVWTDTGSSGRAVWGRCQGSRAAPYQVVIEPTGPAYRCSCPSRKSPCKHALGLLLRWSAGAVPAKDEPDWLPEATAPRRQRTTELADPEAAKQRAARRADRVAAGVAELDSWLTDQVRRGLSGLEQRGYAELGRLAARMVDAQAPGLAASLRRAGAVVGRGHGWPGDLLQELAMVHLATSAHARLDDLAPELAETVRSRIGRTVPTASVLAEGERLTDDWLVLGQVVEIDERLTARRVWLHGTTSGRPALVLSFAPAGQSLDAPAGAPGAIVPATLSFYPGAVALRALVTPVEEAPSYDARPASESVTEALAGYAEALGRDPWLERWPMLLSDVRPARYGDGWALVDASGNGLPLNELADPWPLLSVGAGAGLTVAGEWSDRYGLRPMTCWDDARPVPLP